MRSNAGNYVFHAALKAIARKYRFSSHKAVERARVISQLIALDVTNAMALHRDATDQEAAARRKLIDAAIADFANAIGVVVGAIKEASASLSTTCGTMKQVADDAFDRMASASSAAADTSQRVDAAGAATEELSQSIEHSGSRRPAACRWRNPPSAIRGAPIRPFVRWKKRPCASAPWSVSSPPSRRRPTSWP
jgi:hypothetical protein